MNFSMISVYQAVVRAEDSQGQAKESENLKLFNATFNEESSDSLSVELPNTEIIQNYCKNIIITSKMEKEIPIIALVYIERLLLASGFGVTCTNWRRITLISMIIASKIWDDESFENENFAEVFPDFTTKQINEMERVFLDFIGYNLYIKGNDYTKYYFILRTFTEKNKKSFPLRPLDLQTIIQLQNNSNKAQKIMKDQYAQTLNKSF